MESEAEHSLVRVARIGRPHGIRGEVTVEIFTDSPETRFVEGNKLVVRGGNTSPLFTSLTVEKARWNKKILLLKFLESTDRDTAESLRDFELHAPAQNPLETDEGWFAEELVGLAVHREELRSAKIGEVSDLITGEAQDLLVVRLLNGREVLLPFVEEIVPEIHEEREAIVITPPPGLLELDQD